MRLNCLSWSVFVSSMLMAAMFALAAFAQPPPPVDLAESVVGTPKNGLSSKAFRHNALTTNRKALEILRKYPLNDKLFRVEGGYIARQLRDPMARAMMEELVECALNSKTEVTAKGRNGNKIGQWRGEVGLCQSWYKHGLKESEECQELVTACVMARVNAVGKSIPLSLRSESPIVSPLRDQVLTDTRFRESPRGEDPSEGWPIPSFSTKCRGRECNWSPAHVGTCVPGQEVQLAVDDSSGPSACDSAALRACAGMHGCLGPDLHMLPDGSPLPPYSKHLGEQLGACRRSPLKFACPSDEATAGYYSVMTRPAPASIARQPARTPTVVKVQGSGTYPAREKDVFTFPEGAFYGNMFKPERLTLSCTLNDDAGRTMVCATADQNVCKIDLTSGGSTGRCAERLVSLPYRDVYACYAYTQQVEDDDLAVAALNQRLCGSPDANAKCFPHKPQRCRYKDPGINEVKGAHCEAMGKDGAYGSCASQVEDTKRFTRIITTYLNVPCDFLGESDLCNAMRKSSGR